MDPFSHLLLCGVLMVAAVTDIRGQRIPNLLTFPAMILAFSYHGMTQGPDGLLFSLTGFGLGLGVMLIPYFAGVMGPGDVKLMAVVGAFLGASGAFNAFLLTSLFGGLYALTVLLAHFSTLKAILRGFWDSLNFLLLTKRLVYLPRTRGERLPKLCYGVAIAVGTIVSMAFSETGFSSFGNLLTPAWPV
ncbi:MAG: A24 family peptidase [Thermodesulfobacteriota bacterium]|nr:A24 family peptidase [Thermodesulfobacteriota bacterium]